MRDSWLYVAGIFGLSAIAVAGMVAAEVLRPSGVNTALTGQILGIITPTIAALLVLLRSSANAKALEEVKDKADAAAVEAKAAKHVAAETRQEVRIGNNLTAETLDAVKPGGVELHGPRPYPRAAGGDGPGGLKP